MRAFVEDVRSRLVPKARPMAASLRRWSDDARDRLRGTAVPPWHLRRQVPGDFRSAGREFADYLVTLGGLRPDDRVLDIGCRVGRMTIPLLGYLGPDAVYEGIDDWEEGTSWCQAHLARRAPDVHFRNLAMEPNGASLARGPEPFEPLPYETGQFDFVILGSILHLSPAAFSRLIGEAGRVLRAGGTYFGTWFLRAGHASTEQVVEVPVLACSEDEARQRLDDARLAVRSVYRGSWDGHRPALSFQDVVVATKRA